MNISQICSRALRSLKSEDEQIQFLKDQLNVGSAQLLELIEIDHEVENRAKRDRELITRLYETHLKSEPGFYSIVRRNYLNPVKSTFKAITRSRLKDEVLSLDFESMPSPDAVWTALVDQEFGECKPALQKLLTLNQCRGLIRTLNLKRGLPFQLKEIKNRKKGVILSVDLILVNCAFLFALHKIKI